MVTFSVLLGKLPYWILYGIAIWIFLERRRLNPASATLPLTAFSVLLGKSVLGYWIVLSQIAGARVGRSPDAASVFRFAGPVLMVVTLGAYVMLAIAAFSGRSKVATGGKLPPAGEVETGTLSGMSSGAGAGRWCS